MPPPQVANPPPRRPVGSLRHREGRVHNVQAQSTAASARRRKSRSPEARTKRPATVAGSTLLPSSSNLVVVRSSLHEDAAERSRNKAKPRSRPQTVWIDGDDPAIVTNIVQNLDPSGSTQSARSKRKERSRSRDAALRRTRKTATPDISGDEEEPTYTGPLAHADYQRMKQEVENLRKVRSFALTLERRKIDGRRRVASGNVKEDDSQAEQGQATPSFRRNQSERFL